MYIQELRVDGYGALRDVSIRFEAPVTVVCGPNEAGKSTLIRFVRCMLYGFPTRKDPVERGEPVYGGRHGGLIVVRTRDGRSLSLERHADAPRPGRKAERLIIRDDRGAEIVWSQQEWERQALGGVSDRLFRQLFSVSLDELHELQTLQGEEVGSYLYHSGLAGGALLADARRKLSAEMDKLYRPKGTSPEINRVLAALKEAEAELRLSRASLPAYQACMEDLASVRRRLEERERSLPALAERVGELRAAREKRELWLKLRLIEAEERELTRGRADWPTDLLPEDSSAVWAACLRRRQEAAARLDQAARKVRELRLEREALKWDEQLLAAADELARLESMREQNSARLEERETAAAELLTLDDAIGELIARLDPGWSEDDFAAFCGILAEREPLRRLQRAWNDAAGRRERLEADAARLCRQREALLSEREAAAAGMPDRADPAATAFGPWRPGSREALQEAWNALEDEFRRLERAAAQATDAADAAGSRSAARRRPSGGKLIYGAAAVAALLALVLLLGGAFGLPGVPAPLLFVSAAGMAALSAAAGLADWLRQGAGRRHAASAAPPASMDARQRMVERLQDLLEQPERAASALLGGRGNAGAASAEAAWRQLRRAVQSQLAGMEREERERDRAREWHSRLGQLDREQEALTAAAEAEAAREAACRAEWAAYLRRYKLPDVWTPDSLPELLHLAEQGQAAIRRKARVRERLAGLDQMHAAFREAASALFGPCPPPPSLASDPLLAVSWLHRRAEEQQSIREEAARAERLIRDAEAAEREAGQALQEAEREAALLLEQAGEPDEASFERRLRLDERRRALRREKAEIELRLYAGRSPEAAGKLAALLESHDEGALEAQLLESERMLQEAERERIELLDRQGRLSQELERLRAEAEAEDRRLRLAEWEGKLAQLAERYAVLAICDRLLQETQTVYEQERQPEVQRLASRYFAQMTGGAYRRIVMPAGSASVLAESEGRRMTDSAFLSRGTREQLYLAMRFALADAVSGETPLPLLLDDLFVHFDESRLRRTVPVLEEISGKRQVLLFTCHRHVAEAVREILPDASILHWAGREAARSEVFGPGPSETASPG